MGWIYLAVSGESQKPSKDTSSPSLIVKESDTLKPCSYREWLQETSRLHQYGTTLPRSGGPTCPGSILSTVDSPARTFQLLDAEQVWKESEADYFSRSSGCAANYDPDSSSWRTSQLLLFEDQSELLANFASWGMTVDGAFYPLQMWARITDENAGGSWPTPKAQDSHGGSGKNVQGGPSLTDVVRKWATPTAQDFKKRGPNSKQQGLSNQVFWPTPDSSPRGARINQNGHQVTLQDAVKQAQTKWPTPTVSDSWFADVSDETVQKSLEKSDRPKTQLAAMVRFPTPTSSMEGGRITPGANHDTLRGFREADPTMTGGALNPTWVEWLMGYPCEWTVLEDWVTQWFRPKREKLSND